MPKMLRMPPEGRLPAGAHRKFVEELFMHYREAGRPSLRAIAAWIEDNTDDRELKGTASTETIRRVLSGSVVPRNWSTVEAILEALCGIAERNPDEDRWPEDDYGAPITFKDRVKELWNDAHDDAPGDALPGLPPRPAPLPVPATNLEDPWATGPSGSFTDQEIPF